MRNEARYALSGYGHLRAESALLWRGMHVATTGLCGPRPKVRRKVSAHAHDETHARRPTAADVQRLHRLGTLDLILARGAGHLLVRVEELAHAGAPDRVTRADEAAARVDRVLAADLEPALFDGLPAFTGLGDAEVVDGHVLAGREAIVRLDALNRVHVGDAGAAPGVRDGRA